MTQRAEPHGNRTAGRMIWVVLVLLVVGAITTVLGQISGHAPDLATRIVWAIVPFAVITFRAISLDRATVSDIFLMVIAVFLWGTSMLYSDDEMRLTYEFVPIIQIIVVVPAVALLTLHQWWSRKFRRQ